MVTNREKLEAYLEGKVLVECYTEPHGPDGVGVGTPVWADEEWVAFDRLKPTGGQDDIYFARRNSISVLSSESPRCAILRELESAIPLRTLDHLTFSEVLAECAATGEAVTLSPKPGKRLYCGAIREVGENLLVFETITTKLERAGVTLRPIEDILFFGMRGPLHRFCDRLRKQELSLR